MRPEERFTHKDNQPYRPRRRLELFFFEIEGNRSYLRFTRLAVILILCFTVIPIAAILTLFLYNQASINSEQINVNVRSTASPDVTPLRNVIIQTPTPQPLPKVRQSPLLPPPALPSESIRNMNKQIAPSQTPQHQPAKPPT